VAWQAKQVKVEAVEAERRKVEAVEAEAEGRKAAKQKTMSFWVDMG
jgi:hypothetical protein